MRNRAIELSQSHPTAVACRALGVPRASLYRERRRREFPREVRPRPSPPRTLSGPEREEVAQLLHSRRFVDKAPAAVWANYWTKAIYLCSRTMALKQRNEVTAAATPPPSIRKARAFGHGSQPMLVLGHHQAEGAGQMELFLPVRGAGHLQPLRGGLDGGHSRKFFAGQNADRTKLRPAANRLGTTDFARRPGTVDEIQGTGFAASRSGRHESPPYPGLLLHRFLVNRHQKTFNLRAESRRQVRAQALQSAFTRSPERFPKGRPVPPSLPEAAWINRPNQEDS